MGTWAVQPALIVALALVTTGLVLLDVLRTGRRILADFRGGDFQDALKGTRWLRSVTRRRRSRAALDLNLAACQLAMGRHEEGGETLASIPRADLPETLLPILYNNQAYHLLLSGRDPEEALALADRAALDGPQNPAFRSTRGIAHLAMGQVEDAIAELQTAIDAGLKAQGPAAMSENYFHLARAWEARGEPAYARDHFLKSLNICPECRFAKLSAERLNKAGDRWR